MHYTPLYEDVSKETLAKLYFIYWRKRTKKTDTKSDTSKRSDTINIATFAHVAHGIAHLAYAQYYIEIDPICRDVLLRVTVHIGQPLIFKDKSSNTCLLPGIDTSTHTHRGRETHTHTYTHGNDSSFNFILIIKLTLTRRCLSNGRLLRVDFLIPKGQPHTVTHLAWTHTHTVAHTRTHTHILWQINLSLNALRLPIGRRGDTSALMCPSFQLCMWMSVCMCVCVCV